MGQDGRRQGLHVVGEDVVAALHQRERLRCLEQVDARPRRGTQAQQRLPAGRRHDVDDVPLHRIGCVQRAGHLPEVAQHGGIGDRSDLGERIAGLVGVEHRDLGATVGIAEADLHQEPVALRLRQRVGALHLHGVLGGDDHERLGERVGVAVDGDLLLLHGLEQRRLRLGGGAVDLVAEHDVGEDGAGPELERARALVEHAHAGDVARQQVGRELDAAHGAVDAAREGLGEHRLADAGDVLDEQVALGQERDEGQPDGLGLAGDDALDAPRDVLDDGARLGEAGVIAAAGGQGRCTRGGGHAPLSPQSPIPSPEEAGCRHER